MHNQEDIQQERDTSGEGAPAEQGSGEGVPAEGHVDSADQEKNPKQTEHEALGEESFPPVTLLGTAAEKGTAQTPHELEQQLHQFACSLIDPAALESAPHRIRSSLGLSKLRDVAPERRLELAREVLRTSATHARVPGSLKSTLVKLLRNLGRDEKQDLIDWVSSDLEATQSRKGSYISLILSSAKDFRELYGLVRCSGPKKLLSMESRELSHLVNEVLVIRRLRRLDSPALLNNNASGPVITNKLNEIRASLQEQAEMDLGLSKRSIPARRMKESAKALLEYLRVERKRRRGTPARREFANSLVHLLKTHRHLNLKLSFEMSDGRPAATWNVKGAAELHATIKRLPETPLIATLKLTHIQRRAGSDEATFGDRTGGGLVRIYDYARDEASAKAKYHGISSLKTTLVHEIGHSLKFGRHSDSPKRKEDISEVIRKTNSLLDFDEFVSLSDWKILPSESYRIIEAGHAVEIDGHRYPLGQPVYFEKQRVTFSYDSGQRTLYSYDPNSDFPLDEYSRTNPWEDWAEGFTEYIFVPKRLAEMAPLKFGYFEEQFALYRDKVRIQSVLAEAIRQRKPHSTEDKMTGAEGAK